MIGYELTETDKALIKEFHRHAEAIGMDGEFSLEPTERGVLGVATMVRQQTMLQVCASLGLQGAEAAKLWFDLHRHSVPQSEEAVYAMLDRTLRGGK